MVERLSYVIIGNGIAGITASEILRAEDATAEITIIADDPCPVYYRPALKDYLARRIQENQLWARPHSFYQDHRIRFLEERVVGIQVSQHTVQLQSGRQVGYDRLLLASGARARRLTCPGSELRDVTTLRTVIDYKQALSRLSSVRSVVVYGSGPLALETVETLCHGGFKVTHLLRGRTLWSDVLDLTASDLVLHKERHDGVDVRVGEEIVEITNVGTTPGAARRISGVVTGSGAFIPCELVLVAIGVEPVIDFIKGSGIACGPSGRGVKVDSFMRTNAPDIYAAGDVLETTDVVTGHARVIGQWYPAIQQAVAAAYSMLDLLDNSRPFRSSTFYNAMSMYGFDLASVGLTNIATLPASHSYQEIIANLKLHTYRKVVHIDGVPVGMLALGEGVPQTPCRKSTLAFKRAIDYGVNLMPVAHSLFAEHFDLNGWLDRQGVPPPILSASRVNKTNDVGSHLTRFRRHHDEKTGRQVLSVSGSPYNLPAISVSGPQPPLPTGADKQYLELPAQIKHSYTAALVPVFPVAIQSRTGTSTGETRQILEFAPRSAGTPISQNEVITIGREPDVDLCVNDPSVSRRHAQIACIRHHYVLHDLGSKNGTFVNDTRLEPGKVQVLNPNDRIRFGKAMIYVLQVYPTEGKGFENRSSREEPGILTPG